MYFLPTDDQRELQRGVRDVLDVARSRSTSCPSGFDAALWSTLDRDRRLLAAHRARARPGRSRAGLRGARPRRACPGPLVGTFLAAGTADGPVTVLDPASTPLLVTPPRGREAGARASTDDARFVAAPPAGTALPEPIDPLTPLHELRRRVPSEWRSPYRRRRRRRAAARGRATHRGAAGRPRRAHDRARGRLRQDARAVRPADRFVPGGQAPLRRHARAHRAGPGLAAQRRGDARRPGRRRRATGRSPARSCSPTRPPCGNARSCVQVHGGMGFTWEVPVHFLLKRAWLQATEFGTADEHAEDARRAAVSAPRCAVRRHGRLARSRSRTVTRSSPGRARRRRPTRFGNGTRGARRDAGTSRRDLRQQPGRVRRRADRRLARRAARTRR